MSLTVCACNTVSLNPNKIKMHDFNSLCRILTSFSNWLLLVFYLSAFILKVAQYRTLWVGKKNSIRYFRALLRGNSFSVSNLYWSCSNDRQCRAKRSSALKAKAAKLARADCIARKGGTK